MDPSIEALNLGETARAAAYALKAAHPSVVFTSGRRDKAAQAHAMATNIIKNRAWIRRTYKATLASQRCQKWVDQHPFVGTVDEIAAGLLSVLAMLPASELTAISKHLTGEAFDVQPVADDSIKVTIRGLAGLDKFLEEEGGLVRWHAQFTAPPGAV